MALLLGAAILAAAACGSQSRSVPPLHVAGRPCRGATRPPAYAHVVLIVMENHGSEDVAHSSPFLDGLAAACGQATDYHAVAHPSLPNYLALTSGTTAGITSDCTSCTSAAASIFSQLNGDWRTYAESIPAPGYRGAFSGDYAKKHNPASYFPAVAQAYAHNAIPLDRLHAALAADNLARFTLVVPNLCHDEHDCGVGAGDRWLHEWVPRILRTAAFATGRTALFVTYDEDIDPDNGVFTVVAARSVRPATRVGTRLDHYALLASIERMLGLPCLANACSATVMTGPFHLLKS